uniref:Peptidase M41 domain-containing protein n=1 Tax=Chaetoceros debilis TaxID=122233 RepID=A0A7S3PXS1_9STRA|mmetsp:Transcript_11071/g.16122  ORF Transcript_11071/g.16122 Transcript_11071/m.16122 type:complete len:516 (+) Transcript_11071:149-1696(+)|eukprot:CAMPEP_0194073676 /NCGR_PEP_ID=MMETSP0149-20130528/1001_1 /TAXON_ID=122233 /ORGANISM="Chaetoceros debilis, Strain MM31A-1" /LENGTH=515 /DNA_ID=CAMNT_0038753715 /DNA_START=150 /DNA_END=1697 /DNA_ORIENTATION=+
MKSFLAFLIASGPMIVDGFSMSTQVASPPKTKKAQTINRQALAQLNKCNSGTAARNILSKTFKVEEGSESEFMYKSISIPTGASSLSMSDVDLAIQTNIRNAKYSVMELIELNGDKDADRASLAVLCLFLASSSSAIAAQQSLPGPEILRFVVVWFLSFAPLIFVGFGLATPESLQSALISIQRNIFPTYRKRMIHHEAGHFLIGHLLGFPIKGYQANAVKNAVEFYPLNDSDVGKTRAQLLGFDKRSSGDDDVMGDANSNYRQDAFSSSKPFFSDEGGGADIMLQKSVFRDAKNYTDDPFLQVSQANDITQSWPYRGFDEETIDQLAAVSVAGVCSEILGFGNAEGGFADLSQLRRLFNSAGADGAGLDEKEVDNRVRYAIGFSMGQLRRHLGALDALVEAMEKGSSVEECILAIESCENANGGVSAALMGGSNVNYERKRREQIKNEGIGFIERILLGGGKNADTEDAAVIYGKGGGDRKEKFQLTGDDPLYAAGAAAAAFAIWASSGGLSLH